MAGGVSSLLSLFQHANLRTPGWLGWIVQRPEGHGLHHERGVHAYNYGDLAIWDVVFGTFRNPRTWSGEAGFYDGASSRLGEMLVGRLVDVSPGRREEGERGAMGRRVGATTRAAGGRSRRSAWRLPPAGDEPPPVVFRCDPPA